MRIATALFRLLPQAVCLAADWQLIFIMLFPFYLQLDAIRVSASKASPMMDTINKVTVFNEHFSITLFIGNQINANTKE